MGEYRFRVEDPGKLGLAGIVERLGAIIAYYRGYMSTHERTKEVWGALEALLRLSEKKWSEWIPLLADRYTPKDRWAVEDRNYFKELLNALLAKFADEVRGYNPATKSLLAKTIRDALDAASSSPYPQLCFFVKEFHPDRLCDNRFREKCAKVVGHECQ